MAVLRYQDEALRENCRWVATDLRHICLTLESTKQWASQADTKRLAAMQRELAAMAQGYEAKAKQR